MKLMICSSLKFQFQSIKNNLAVFFLMVLATLLVLGFGYSHEHTLQAVTYILAMWLCSFFIDIYALWKPTVDTFEVRNPKQESFYFILSLSLGLLFLFLRFSGLVDWQHLKPVFRLLSIPLILFVFPVGLAIIMLLLKYKPVDLGLRFQGLLVVIPIVSISIITMNLLPSNNFTWNKIVEESGGVLAALFAGLITAGLSEEFFRVIGQTRLGALFNNKGMGWFVTTLIWALMHAPKWYSENNDLSNALLSSVRIIPLGLMWGYITHRIKSFLPAVIVHGMNVWGLQNF